MLERWNRVTYILFDIKNEIIAYKADNFSFNVYLTLFFFISWFLIRIETQTFKTTIRVSLFRANSDWGDEHPSYRFRIRVRGDEEERRSYRYYELMDTWELHYPRTFPNRLYLHSIAELLDWSTTTIPIPWPGTSETGVISYSTFKMVSFICHVSVASRLLEKYTNTVGEQRHACPWLRAPLMYFGTCIVSYRWTIRLNALVRRQKASTLHVRHRIST